VPLALFENISLDQNELSSGHFQWACAQHGATGMPLFCGCIHGFSLPIELYTAVHTTTECTARNSLTYKDRQLKPKWLSACHIEDDPVCWLGQSTNRRRTQMKDRLLKLSVKMQTLLTNEEGQDLIEYALVVALIAFAATVGMSSLAVDINKAFTDIGTLLTKYTG
jgi:pilus assembly protein Flp/PilA